jgi:hypothetical protein
MNVVVRAADFDRLRSALRRLPQDLLAEAGLDDGRDRGRVILGMPRQMQVDRAVVVLRQFPRLRSELLRLRLKPDREAP